MQRGLCRRSKAGKEAFRTYQQSDVKHIGFLLDYQNVDVVKLYQNVDVGKLYKNVAALKLF